MNKFETQTKEIVELKLKVDEQKFINSLNDSKYKEEIEVLKKKTTSAKLDSEKNRQ